MIVLCQGRSSLRCKERIRPFSPQNWSIITKFNSQIVILSQFAHFRVTHCRCIPWFTLPYDTGKLRPQWNPPLRKVNHPDGIQKSCPVSVAHLGNAKSDFLIESFILCSTGNALIRKDCGLLYLYMTKWGIAEGFDLPNWISLLKVEFIHSYTNPA